MEGVRETLGGRESTLLLPLDDLLRLHLLMIPPSDCLLLAGFGKWGRAWALDKSIVRRGGLYCT